MSSQRIAEARRLKLAAERAEQEAIAAFKLAFPLGGTVAWEDNRGGIQYGFVERHGYGDRIKVLNGATGACYWVQAYRVFQAHTPSGKPL